MKKYEYIWLDGHQPEQSLRSKIKATAEVVAPVWNFDGSSTQQAGGGDSDCVLKPAQEYPGPLTSDVLVMNQVLLASK